MSVPCLKSCREMFFVLPFCRKCSHSPCRDFIIFINTIECWLITSLSTKLNETRRLFNKDNILNSQIGESLKATPSLKEAQRNSILWTWKTGTFVQIRGLAKIGKNKELIKRFGRSKTWFFIKLILSSTGRIFSRNTISDQKINR